MTYEEALSALNGLEGRPWRNGLDRMQAFIDRVGLRDSLSRRAYVHIAGTNGKGTTTALVESILRGQGWKTGAFFSPYIVDYRERLQVNGEMIPATTLVALAERLLPIAESMTKTPYGGITKFELEAAMGFAFWEDERCDWVALEVGLGGRLDATNVVCPRASVITSIGLDHTAILGGTVEEIAAEKGGIVKPGVPVILGSMPPQAQAVIERIAGAQSAPLWRLGREILLSETTEGWTVTVPGHRVQNLEPTLTGSRTPQNMALAVAACFASGAVRDPGTLREAIRGAWLPGRFDVRSIEGRSVVFDGAHNADAARALVEALGSQRVRLVSNMVAGHETRGFYEAFRHHAVGVEVAPIDSPRALRSDEAVLAIEAAGLPATSHPSLRAAMHAALKEPEPVVVTGSNYLVGEALRLFG